MYSCHRGVAKAGKKQKVGGSSKDPKTTEPEKQAPEAPEASIQTPEDLASDPPPLDDSNIFEAMDVETNLAISHDPPSPKLPSPAKLIEEIPLNKDSDGVTITGTACTVPGASTVLTKHSTKEESPSLEKGKAKLDLGELLLFQCRRCVCGLSKPPQHKSRHGSWASSTHETKV
jgi:hypothetical protein